MLYISIMIVLDEKAFPTNENMGRESKNDLICKCLCQGTVKNKEISGESDGRPGGKQRRTEGL